MGQLMLALAAALLLGSNAATLLVIITIILDTFLWALLFTTSYTTPYTLLSYQESASWILFNFIGAAALLLFVFYEIKASSMRIRQSEEALAATRREATAALGSALNVQDTLNWILVLLEGVVAYDSACIFILDGDTQYIAAARGFDDIAGILNHTYPASDPLTQEIITNKKPIWIYDTDVDPYFEGWAGTKSIRGWMGVPIIVQQEVLGRLTLDSMAVGAYGEETAVLVTKFANQAAIAIENSHLFAETQRQTRQLLALNDLTRKMTGSLSTQVLCEAIAEQLSDEYGDQEITVFTIDTASNCLILRGTASNPPQTNHQSEQQRIPLGEGIVGQVALSGEMYLENRIEDTHKDDENADFALTGQSRIVLPLLVNDAVIGVLSIKSGLFNAFDDSEVAMLRSLSDHIALALEKTRLLEETQHQHARAQALQQVGSLIASSLSLTETLNTIIEQAATIMGAPHSHIYLTQSDTYLSWDASETVTNNQLCKSFSLWVVNNNQYLAVYEVSEDERVLNADFAHEHNLHSYLGVPITVKGNLIGVLAILTAQATHFLDDEYDLLLAIARQAGVAVENGRLFEQSQQHALILEETVSLRTADLTVANKEQARLRKELEGYTNRLEQLVQHRTHELTETNDALRAEIINRRQLQKQIQISLTRRAQQVQISTRVSQEIAAAPALDTLFRKVVELIQYRFDYYHVQVFISVNDIWIMQEAAGVGRAQMIENRHSIPMDAPQSVVARAARNKQAILSTDVLNDPDWLPNAALPATKTELAVPIKLGDRVLGVLDIQHDEVDSLTTEDELLMLGLCGQIAIAINNRHLETKQQLAERALKAYTEELERSNRELQNFAYVASHDLQEPLRKILAFGDRLESRYADVLDERGADYLRRMQNASARMQILINDLLTFSRVTTKARPFTTVNLEKIAKGVVSDLEIQLEQTNGRVVLKSLPTIKADRVQMRQLLQNLISNGLKFHKPDTDSLVTVTGSTFIDNNGHNMCQLTISDNGIGFDEKYADRIFGIFQRLHTRTAYQGTGIGLAICRKIAKRHHGTIIAHSKKGEGATFIVQLPQTQESDEVLGEV